MQKMAAQYIAAKVVKELTSRPAATSRDLDGQDFTDDEGRSLGTIRRLRELAVYVVVGEDEEDDGAAEEPDRVLRRCLTEPKPRVFAETADGQMTALIYVPSTLKPRAVPPPPAPEPPAVAPPQPAPTPPRPRGAGLHADDV